MNLDDAIKAHADWKVKFRVAISKKELMDSATICKDNCCNLGKWLYGEGKSKHGSLAEFQAVVGAHKNFHTEAGKIANLINVKDYERAEKEMAPGTSYTKASMAVSTAIVILQRVL